MTILVAEDDRATRLRIAISLRAWGYEVIEAVDGNDAWEKFQAHSPAIILTDWQMPGMDGVDLIRHIRANPKEVTYRYTILLTSRSGTKDLVEGLESGADDFVAKPFDKDELRVRVAAGKRIVRLKHALEMQNLKLETSNQRMKASLLAAAKIQQSFLPPRESNIGDTRFACHYEPCDELAGDTLNYFPLNDRHVAIYNIDVSGHGVPAALLSVHLSRVLTRLRGPDKILLENRADGSVAPVSPAKVLMALNRRFMCDSGNEQYFTMNYGVLDLEDRTFRYSSAGHPGPILLSGGATTILGAMPPAVGFLPNPEFQEASLNLEPGDRLLFYTDGVFEVADKNDEQFGEHRIAEQFKKTRDSSLGTALKNLLFTAQTWGEDRPFDDDISLLAIEIGEAGDFAKSTLEPLVAAKASE